MTDQKNIARANARDSVIIAGPTASGKSALAIEIAQALDGEIINADSMQVYRDLRVLSARPDAAEEAQAPHHLFGYLDGAVRCSAARWAADAAEAIAAVRARGRLPVVVGGTGFYIKALTEGLSPVPQVPDAAVRAAEARLAAVGLPALAAEVFAQDPALETTLSPPDPQRVLRAWSVFEATGIPLSDWQARPREAVADLSPLVIALVPDRGWLYARCDARFDAMLEGGALEEVAALLARDLAPDLPVMKAVGVPELAAYLAGTCDLADARAQAAQATRNYAKRQFTWLRNQIIADILINEQLSEINKEEFFSKIHDFLLTL